VLDFMSRVPASALRVHQPLPPIDNACIRAIPLGLLGKIGLFLVFATLHRTIRQTPALAAGRGVRSRRASR
jgi:hypothetical protein